MIGYLFQFLGSFNILIVGQYTSDNLGIDDIKKVSALLRSTAMRLFSPAIIKKPNTQFIDNILVLGHLRRWCELQYLGVH